MKKRGGGGSHRPSGGGFGGGLKSRSRPSSPSGGPFGGGLKSRPKAPFATGDVDQMTPDTNQGYNQRRGRSCGGISLVLIIFIVGIVIYHPGFRGGVLLQLNLKLTLDTFAVIVINSQCYRNNSDKRSNAFHG
jgi:hypothetical protein